MRRAVQVATVACVAAVLLVGPTSAGAAASVRGLARMQRDTIASRVESGAASVSASSSAGGVVEVPAAAFGAPRRLANPASLQQQEERVDASNIQSVFDGLALLPLTGSTPASDTCLVKCAMRSAMCVHNCPKSEADLLGGCKENCAAAAAECAAECALAVEPTAAVAPTAPVAPIAAPASDTCLVKCGMQSAVCLHNCPKGSADLLGGCKENCAAAAAECAAECALAVEPAAASAAAAPVIADM